MAFETKTTVPQMTGAVFATITPSECYHSTPTCPSLVAAGGRFVTKPTQYASKTAAFSAGHLRPCEICRGRLAVKVDDVYVHLTVEQLAALRIIYKMTSAGAAIRLLDLARACGRHISTALSLVDSLQKKKLVRKEYAPGRRKARNGSIRHTPLAVRVLMEMEGS
jgi:hypothetical protein